MAFKVSKPQAMQLFMYVRHLKFNFDPFSKEAKSVRGASRLSVGLWFTLLASAAARSRATRGLVESSATLSFVLFPLPPCLPPTRPETCFLSPETPAQRCGGK